MSDDWAALLAKIPRGKDGKIHALTEEEKINARAASLPTWARAPVAPPQQCPASDVYIKNAQACARARACMHVRMNQEPTAGECRQSSGEADATSEHDLSLELRTAAVTLRAFASGAAPVPANLRQVPPSAMHAVADWLWPVANAVAQTPGGLEDAAGPARTDPDGAGRDRLTREA